MLNCENNPKIQIMIPRNPILQRFQMIKYFTLLVLLSVPFSVTAQEEIPEEELDLRLYVMGNSLTDTLRYEDFGKYVAEAGKKMRLARLTVPGAPIGWLWEHNLDEGGFTTRPYGNPRHAFANYQWDAFSFQPFQWNYDRNIQDIPKFMDLLFENSPEAQVYIYAQWPHAGDGGDWTRRWLEPRTEEIMSREEYEDTVKWCLENLDKGKPVKLIPAGHIMHLLEQKAKAGEFPGISTMWEIYNDGVHLSNVGSFIVGNAYYATNFGESPEGLDYSMYNSAHDKFEITDEMAAIIQKSAWQVVASHPYTGVTSDEPVEIATPVIDPGVKGSEYYYELFGAFGGGTADEMKWTVSAGALADGMSLSERGVLQGTPTEAGQGRFTVTVQGKNGSTAEREFELVIEEDTAPQPRIPGEITLNQGEYIWQELKVESNNPPIFWSAPADELPYGITLSEGGILEGAAGKPGEYIVNVSVKDGDTTEPEEAVQQMFITVKENPDALFARKLESKPNMDGKPEGDPWAFQYALDKKAAGESNNEVNFDFGWFEETLYLAVLVKDDMVIAKHPPEQGDHVIIFIDGKNNREEIYNWDDVALKVNPKGQHEGGRFGVGIRASEVDGGYFAEAAIELKRVGRDVNPNQGRPIGNLTIGVDVMNIDVDDEGADAGSAAKLVWHGSETNMTDPSQFRTVIFEPDPSAGEQ